MRATRKGDRVMSSQTYQDRLLTCVDCGQDFQWKASEQEFFAQRGFHQPKRCKACKQVKKERTGGDAGRAGGGQYGNGNRAT